jgi:hypothetical protein
MLVGMSQTAAPTARRVTRLRVRLLDADPPVWRLFEVPADTTLAELHKVLQCVLGWTDSHLHAFTTKGRYDTTVHDHGRRWEDLDFCMDLIVGEEPPEDECDVTVGELFGEDRPPIFYEYDFGDSWWHGIVWEGETERAESPDWIGRVLDGSGRCPLEDSGGIGGWAEVVRAVANPRHADHDDMRVWAGDAIGDNGLIDAAAFDPREAQARLVRLSALTAYGRRRASRADRPTILDGLADRFSWGQLHWWTEQCGAPVELVASLGDSPGRHIDSIPDAAAARMTADLRWLLGQVASAGSGGLRLTGHGWLPTALVSQAVADLGYELPKWGRYQLIESNLDQLAALRLAAQELGLLRLARGALCVTRLGGKLVSEPLGLMRHLAVRLADRAAYQVERDAMALTALQAAFLPGLRSSADIGVLTATGLTALGWASADRSPLSPYDARELAEPFTTLLAVVGAARWPREARGGSFATFAAEPGRQGFARAFLTAPAGKVTDG